MTDNWSFYVIKNKECTYAGVSPDPVQRLRKHNGEICGGANIHCLRDVVGNTYALFMDSMIKYNPCNLNGQLNM